MTRIPMLAMLLLCAALGAHAQTMYKWVDEKGRTHYSQDPPPDGKGEKVEVKPANATSRPAATDWKQRELESRQRRIERDQKDEYEKAQAHNAAAERRNRCSKARAELDTLESQVPVYHLDEKGQRVYLEDKDRPREIEAWKKVARENCD